MAQFFASVSFGYGSVSFGVKDQEFIEFIDDAAVSTTASEAYQEVYELHDLLPYSIDRSSIVLIQDILHYSEMFHAYSRDGISFSFDEATSGIFNYFGSGSDGFDWFLTGVSVSAVLLDGAVSSSTVADDFALFVSLFGGNDQIFLSQSADSFDAGSGDDLLYGFGGNDTLNGGDGTDTINGGTGTDILIGGGGADVMCGGEGDDVYHVDNLNDRTLEAVSDTDVPLDIQRYFEVWLQSNPTWLEENGFGGIQLQVITSSEIFTGLQFSNPGEASGFDYWYKNISESIDDGGEDLVYSSVTWSLGKNVENLYLTGSAAINGTGNTLNNVITGNSGNNTLTGGDGTDTLIGGLGDDTYVVDNLSDTITEAANAGTDSVQSSATITLASNVENLTLTGSGAINGTGNTLNNVITGNSGNNTLNGGDGTDTLIGGLGDDTYVVDNLSDTITEAANAGTDTVQSSATITLGANVEHLTLTGSAAIDGTGNSLNNTITGNSSANTLNGGTGTDTLNGGLGDDTYITDGGDTIIEGWNAGIDTVQSSVTYILSSNFENLTLTGSVAINGTGNSLNNIILGNSSRNILNGVTGNDTLVGGSGDDTYVTDGGDTITEDWDAGIDTVLSSVTHKLDVNVERLTLTGSTAIDGTGNDLNNVLTGNSNNNMLDGATGADTLIGGLGNDIYITDGDDTIIEVWNAGTDTVRSYVNYTLGANLENLTLIGSSAINGTGNTLNNVIIGNSAANTLSGGTGRDTLTGGAGDDTYVTDGGDTITEAVDAGTDTVHSSVTYTLGANLENLTLTGSTSINGIGNDLNNVLTGNRSNNTLNGGSGNDSLNGGAGIDTLIGGVGDDIYFTDGGDRIIEDLNEGTDTVYSSVSLMLRENIENLILTGSAAIHGAGNALDNVITGNNAANTLNGGAGIDTLIGGAGNDTFVFSSITDSGTKEALSDVITDFVRGHDKINLSAIDAFSSSGFNDTFIWKGITGFNSKTKGEVRYEKFDNAGTTNDYTMVWIDNDADTDVEMAIRLTGLHDLAASDFIL